MLPVVGEIVLGVINDMVGTQRAGRVHIPRAAHGRDFRPERFGQLHRKGPHPPEAPLISTCCPARIRPLSRSPCRAVTAAIGTAAACANDRLAGFTATASSRAQTYSANPPQPPPERSPKTASPGCHWVTLRPTASTRPALAAPRIGCLGLSSPAVRRTRNGAARRKWRSAAFTAAACTLIKTSSSWGVGFETSCSARTSCAPYLV